MTSFYATLRTRSRGALPLLSADSSPTLRGAGATPLATPCCLPSSVTLSLGRSSPERAFLAYLSTKDFPQSLQRKRPTPARVFPFFLTLIEPQAGQQQSVFSCVSGESESVSGLVTDTLFRPLDTLKRPCSHL